MSEKEMTTQEYLDKIVALAIEAGKAILDIYTRDKIEVTSKDDSSPLTLADTASNDIIAAGLKKLGSAVPILSEESKEEPYSVRKGWRTFWLVDPLDGTKEFIKKNGEFTVNIALIKDGYPVLGVVHAPAKDVTYSASVDCGAFKTKSHSKMRIAAGAYNGIKLKVVGSRSHGGEDLERFVSKLPDVEFVSMGSSLKLCLVADGSADLYPRLGPTMEWDTAAAQAVVECAGGTVTDLKGSRLRYNKENLLNPFFMVAGNPPFLWQTAIE